MVRPRQIRSSPLCPVIPHLLGAFLLLAWVSR